jgi:hypothetical protein
VWLPILQGHPALGQEQVISREYVIKAGVISLLAKCVTWPAERAPSSLSPLTIGVWGDDPFFESGVNQLDLKVREESRRGTIIVVKRFTSAADYRPCHILFVSSAIRSQQDTSPLHRLKEARRIVGEEPVLIVGDAPDLARNGAAANLVFDRATNLIRLEINPDAAARANLKLSSDLLRLKLVTIVRETQD